MQSILIDIAILSSLWLYTVGIQKIIHHRCIQVHTVSKQTERLIWHSGKLYFTVSDP